jgi:hypothetical protein
MHQELRSLAYVITKLTIGQVNKSPNSKRLDRNSLSSTMRKSKIIAACLIHSGITTHPIADVEHSVEQTFNEDFKGMDYLKWNTHVNEEDAQRIIQEFGNSYRIDVRQFIQDLM